MDLAGGEHVIERSECGLIGGVDWLDTRLPRSHRPITPAKAPAVTGFSVALGQSPAREVPPLGEAGRAPRGLPVVGARAVAVAGEFLRCARVARSRWLRAIWPSGSREAISSRPASGPCTIATATARLSVVIGPRRIYLRAALPLLAISLAVPLTAADTAISTKLTLAAAHLIARAIIIPAVARRLSH